MKKLFLAAALLCAYTAHGASQAPINRSSVQHSSTSRDESTLFNLIRFMGIPALRNHDEVYRFNIQHFEEHARQHKSSSQKAQKMVCAMRLALLKKVDDKIYSWHPKTTYAVFKEGLWMTDPEITSRPEYKEHMDLIQKIVGSVKEAFLYKEWIAGRKESEISFFKNILTLDSLFINEQHA